jgi:hypothetical protein
MGLFCLLWIPLFYFFRRSITVSGSGAFGGGKAIWAFLLGCAAVIVRFFTGPLVSPGGFGFSGWMSGFIDIVSLPVIVPLFVCLLLVLTGIFPKETDFAGFMLIWLIPAAAYRSVTWISPAFPYMLVLVPLLWTAQCIGMAFFVNYLSRYPRWYVITLSVLGMAAAPIITATCWWAFFSQQTLLGFFLLFVCLVPSAVLMVISFREK